MDDFENCLIFSKDIYDYELNLCKNDISIDKHKNIILYSVIITSLANTVLNEPEGQEFFIYRNKLKKICQLLYPSKKEDAINSLVHSYIEKAISDEYIERFSKYAYDEKKTCIVRYPKFIATNKLINFAHNMKQLYSAGIYVIRPEEIKRIEVIKNYYIIYNDKQYSTSFGGSTDLATQIYNEYKEQFKKDYSSKELSNKYAEIVQYVKDNIKSFTTIKSNLKNVIDISYNDYAKIYKDILYKKSVKNHIAYINVSELMEIINELAFSNNENDIKTRNTLIHIKNNLVNNTLMIHYFRSEHGRYYAIGPSLQFVSKKYRDRILSEYTAIDISAATFSILYNYSLKLGYSKENMRTIHEYMKNAKSFRQKIYDDLLQSDNYVQFDYVKKILNALAFGANINETLVLQDIQRGTRKTIPVQTEGWANPETPLNIVINEHVVALKKELSEVMTFLTNKHKAKNDGKLYLINSSLQKMIINNKVSRGKKLAHIYQSAESEILLTIINSEYKGKKLLDSFGAIGLLLHDGVYVKNDVFEKLGGLSYFENIILDSLGYNLSIVKE